MNHQKLRPKNRNEHIVNRAIIALGIALLVIALLTACQKESSFTSLEKPVTNLPRIEADHHLQPPGGYHEGTRKRTPELEAASRRGGIKGKPQKPPQDTTQQPPADTTTNPTYTVKNVLYLDFDGETVRNTSWNVNGDIVCAYSGMTGGEIDYVKAQLRAAFEPLGFLVTTDRALYNLAPVGKSHNVITESWEWYGRAGGVAYVGSYAWSSPTPCFTFSSLLGYSGRNVAYASAHELGHTLGLRHVPQRDSYGVITAPYCADCPNYMGGNYGSLYPKFETYVLDLYDNPVNQIQVMQSFRN